MSEAEQQAPDAPVPADPTEAAPQGSAEWRAARLGKITASQFGKIVTPVRGQASTSKGACQYIREVAAEILTGRSVEQPVTRAMQWGIDHEQSARELYEALHKCDVQQVGFVHHPEEPFVGGSPDFLVGLDGGGEIKCPENPAIHIGYAIDGMPSEHTPQVQGGLWLTHRKWWDFVSYHPWFGDIKQALVIQRIERDEAYIERLEEAVFTAVEALKETLTRMRES
jgi:hypothetical protein